MHDHASARRTNVQKMMASLMFALVSLDTFHCSMYCSFTVLRRHCKDSGNVSCVCRACAEPELWSSSITRPKAFLSSVAGCCQVAPATAAVCAVWRSWHCKPSFLDIIASSLYSVYLRLGAAGHLPAGAVRRTALPRGACAFGRVWMLEHCSGSSQVLRAHDTILGTLQHRHKTVQDLYILLVMVPKGTR